MQQQKAANCSAILSLATIPFAPVATRNLGKLCLLSGRAAPKFIPLPPSAAGRTSHRRVSVFFHRTGYLTSRRTSVYGLAAVLLQGFEVCFGTLFILNTPVRTLCGRYSIVLYPEQFGGSLFLLNLPGFYLLSSRFNSLLQSLLFCFSPFPRRTKAASDSFSRVCSSCSASSVNNSIPWIRACTFYHKPLWRRHSFQNQAGDGRISSVPVSFSSSDAFSPCSAFRKVEKSFLRQQDGTGKLFEGQANQFNRTRLQFRTGPHSSSSLSILYKGNAGTLQTSVLLVAGTSYRPARTIAVTVQRQKVDFRISRSRPSS